MAIILGSIGAYSLATLSETKDASVAKLRMTDLLRVILPLTALSLGMIGLLSVPLLSVLFTNSFRSASAFFPLQLSASYFQATAWIVGAPLLGFGFVRTWMFIELLARRCAMVRPCSCSRPSAFRRFRPGYCWRSHSI